MGKSLRCFATLHASYLKYLTQILILAFPQLTQRGHCGRVCIGKRMIILSWVYAGQKVGVSEMDYDIWLVSFIDDHLGFLDNRNRLRARMSPVPSARWTSKFAEPKPVTLTVGERRQRGLFRKLCDSG